MTTHKTAISFQAEPPLQEGQFLRSPILQRGQAMRAFVILAIVFAGAALLGLRPARAAALPAAGSADQLITSQIPRQAPLALPEAGPLIEIAQIDLSKTRRQTSKKKVPASA